MTLFHEWHDVVVYPHDGNRVRNRQQRLDTSQALDPFDPRFSPGCPEGAKVSLRILLGETAEDRFEAMEVGDYGEVTVWTERKVFQLWSREPPSGERFKAVRRHPPGERAV